MSGYVNRIHRIARRIAFVPQITLTGRETLEPLMLKNRSDVFKYAKAVENKRNELLATWSKDTKHPRWIYHAFNSLKEYTRYISTAIKKFFEIIERNAKKLGLPPMDVSVLSLEEIIKDYHDKCDKALRPSGSNAFLDTPDFPACCLNQQDLKDLIQAMYLMIHDPLHEIMKPGSALFLAQHDQKPSSFTMSDRAEEDVPARLTEKSHFDVGVVAKLIEEMRNSFTTDWLQGSFSDDVIKMSRDIKNKDDFKKLSPFHKKLFNAVVNALESKGADAINNHPDPDKISEFREFRKFLEPIMETAYTSVIDKQWTSAERSKSKRKDPDAFISDALARAIRMYMTYMDQALNTAAQFIDPLEL